MGTQGPHTTETPETPQGDSLRQAQRTPGTERSCIESPSVLQSLIVSGKHGCRSGNFSDHSGLGSNRHQSRAALEKTERALRWLAWRLGISLVTNSPGKGQQSLTHCGITSLENETCDITPGSSNNEALAGGAASSNGRIALFPFSGRTKRSALPRRTHGAPGGRGAERCGWSLIGEHFRRSWCGGNPRF